MISTKTGPYELTPELSGVLEKYGANVFWCPATFGEGIEKRSSGYPQHQWGLLICTTRRELIDVLLSLIRQVGQGHYWTYPIHSEMVYCARLPYVPYLDAVEKMTEGKVALHFKNLT